MTAAGRRILCVTEDPLIRAEASFAFPTDVEVTLAADAREGIAQMRETPPDLVIVDIQTGSAGGYSLAKEMSQWAQLAGIPILMLLERSQDEWLARQAGAARTRVKPIQSGDLVTEALALLPDAA